MELLSDNGYEVLLHLLTPADIAALRLASVGWQVGCVSFVRAAVAPAS